MAFTITGNLKNNGANIAGASIQLRTASTDVLLDSDTTDGGGNYSVGSTTSLQVKVWVERGGSHQTSSPSLDPVNQTYNFTSAPNVNPSLGSVPNVSYAPNTGVQTADHSISDSDGDVVTMHKLSGPSWYTTDTPDNAPPPYTGRRYFDTTGVAEGVYNASTRVTDDWFGASATVNFTITIESPNDPPVLTNPGNKSYANDSGNQTLQLVATDPDGGPSPLTYFRVQGPAWGAVNASTGLITFDTNAATKGMHTFQWGANDGEDNSNLESHTVTITNNLPVLTNPGDLSYTKNTGNQTEQLVATDLDDEDTLTFSKVSGDAGITISATGLITVDTNALAEATYPVTARVSDGTANDDESFNVTIFTPDPRPEFHHTG